MAGYQVNSTFTSTPSPQPMQCIIALLNIYMFQLKPGCQFWSMGSDKILAPGWKKSGADSFVERSTERNK